ncbi:unnamed protein product [marine sediment metagenome]|uniref:Uncharacterized protein n=1 Tax=marine sediment metagenome TaxID=412755 RepID=X1Q0T1_9ZZZZ
MTAKQVKEGRSEVEIQYKRVVREEGNPTAVKSMYEVFDRSDSLWRSLGNIPGSGLKLKYKFLRFDARAYFPVKKIKSSEPAGCECGNVLKGIKKPTECNILS